LYVGAHALAFSREIVNSPVHGKLRRLPGQVLWCEEYTILRRAVAIRRKLNDDLRPTIAILCEETEAGRLLVAAESPHVPAVKEIRQSLGVLRDL